MLDVYELKLEKVGEIDYEGPLHVDSYERLYEVFEAYGLYRRAEEHIILLTIDKKGDVTGLFEASHGTTSEAVLCIKDLMKRALLANAEYIAVAHNHTMNNVKPSQNDIECTKAIVRACNYLDLTLFDDMIVGNKKGLYYSMREKGDLRRIENSVIKEMQKN